MKKQNKMSISDPWITKYEANFVKKAMLDGWIGYQYVEEFQPTFAKYHNRKYGIMTPNCHSAIHLLLLALGIKKGDEVIVPECSWIGTVAPVVYTGATPVFCDIEEETWCLDPKSVEKRITKNTKAIIVVDVYSNMPDMDSLIQISEKYKIPLIEDAAESLGSSYKGIRAGKFGIGSTFSFHRTKTLTTGEGGMLLLDDEKLYKRAMFLRDTGRHLTIPYWTVEVAPKYMPFNIQAAIGLAQFHRLDKLLARKRQIFGWYRKHLADIKDIQLNQDNDIVHNGAWANCLVFDKSTKITKKKAIAELTELGLPSRPFFYPFSMLPAFKNNKTGSRKINPIAYSISERGINLPSSFSLKKQSVKEYCNAIRSIIKKYAEIKSKEKNK